MIAVDWSRVAAMGVLAAAILTGWASIPLLYAVLFIVNAGEIVFRSASQAMLVNVGTYAASAILIGCMAGTYRPHREAGETSSRPAPVWADVAEGFRWLIRQRLLRTMAVLIGLLNLTLTGALAVPVLLARERLHLARGLRAALHVRSGWGAARVGHRRPADRLGDRHLDNQGRPHNRGRAAPDAGDVPQPVPVVGIAWLAFGVHGALWTSVGTSLRQRLTRPLAARLGITAPYWAGFGVAAAVSVATWRVFSRAAVADAYATPDHADTGEFAATP
jgi:hypothetical protein